MSDILYSKLRLQVPQELDGEDTTITNEHGNTRIVELSSPITDIMLPGMEKYRVQVVDNNVNLSFGYGQISKVELKLRERMKKLPYNFYSGSAVVYRNEIHILGGGRDNDVTNAKKHYKWNGSSWVYVSTLPVYFYSGSAVVYRNEIHILGGDSPNAVSGTQNHFKWNGSSWASVSALPNSYSLGKQAVVYNNEIHLLGFSYDSNSHHKWNGSEWVSVSTIPYSFSYGYAVIYNNEIHILGGMYSNQGMVFLKNHYKWNGSEWVSVSTLPENSRCAFGSGVVYNNEIYLLGGGYTSTEYKNCYKWDGVNWTVSQLPYGLYGGSAVVRNNNDLFDEIVILGTSTTNYQTYDAQYDGTEWTIGTD